MDVTAVETFLETTATGAVATVAAAALILVVGIKVWKRLRSAS